MGLFGKSGLQGHAGGSSSPGHSAAAVPVGLLGPPIHNMGLLVHLLYKAMVRTAMEPYHMHHDLTDCQ